MAAILALALLLQNEWGPGEHLPGRARPPAPGAPPAGLAPYGERIGTKARTADERAFDALVDDYLRFALLDDPVTATALGFHEYDALMPARDSLARAATLDSLARFDAQLSRLRLGGARAADRLRLRDIVRERDPVEDPGACIDYAARGLTLLFASDYAPLEERAWNVVARVNEVGGVLRAGRATLGTPTRADTERAIASARAFADYLSNRLPVQFAAVKDPVLRSEFDHHLAQAAGAAADYHEWLVREVLPRATEGSAHDGRHDEETLRALLGPRDDRRRSPRRTRLATIGCSGSRVRTAARRRSRGRARDVARVAPTDRPRRRTGA
jgi:hypothetical protein